MDVKPGFKQTEVGVIPEDWEVDTVGGEFSIQLGKMLDSEKNVGVPKPFLGNRAVQWGRIDLSDIGVIKLTPSDLQRFRLRDGDLLVCEGGEIGRAAIWREPIEECYYQKALHRLRPKRGYNVALMLNILQRLASTGSLQNFVTQTSIAHLPKDKFERVLIPIPPTKAEREAIAEALSDADALIESLYQLLVKKRHLKQGAMQELLTGKKRLPGFEVNAGLKQTEVGLIPTDWEVERLAAICSMKSGEGITSAKIDQFSKYPCYGGNGLRGFTTRFTHDGPYSLIGRQGALCGNVLGVEGRFFASEHAIVVTASPRTDIRWLTFVLGEMRLNQYSESSAQPGLSVSKLLSLDLAHPPTKAEQEAIATILSDMDAEIAVLEAKLAKVRNLKLGMMQELLTGRIRLV
jgi:type I restriction enzyme S subunit